jgi:hypothetical protein
MSEPSFSKCPHCGVLVAESKDRVCLVCRKFFDSPVTPSPTTRAESMTPSAAQSRRPSIIGTNGRFARQAAKFSLFAPFVLWFMNSMALRVLQDQKGTDVGYQTAFVLVLTTVLTNAVALGFGIFAVVQGVRFRLVGVIVMSILGVFLNAFAIYFAYPVLMGFVR